MIYIQNRKKLLFRTFYFCRLGYFLCYRQFPKDLYLLEEQPSFSLNQLV